MNRIHFIVVVVCSLLIMGASNALEDKLIVARKSVDAKCLAILRNTTAIDRNRCEFYKCFEERFPCGSSYYVMNLGYKYCIRYTANNFSSNFTEQGKKLIDQMVDCLPRAFEKTYKTKKSVKCGRLNKEGYEAQEKCYVDKLDAFCKGLPENKALFRKAMDFGDILSYEAIAMMQRMGKRCGQDNLVAMALSYA